MLHKDTRCVIVVDLDTGGPTAVYACLLEGPFQAQDLIVRVRCPAELWRAAAVKEDHQACGVGAHLL